VFFSYLFVSLDNPFPVRVRQILERNPAQNTRAQLLNHLTAFHQGGHFYAVKGAAVFVRHDDVMSNINQSSREVS
jgi:hypothetical protein